jgi:(R)-2-hydroxyacyl-CoA dehydratese activating ATPase
MITAGLDIGSGTTKGVLLEDGRRTLRSALEPTRGQPAAAGRRVLERLVEEENLLPGDVDYVCTTGFGRYAYPDRQLQVSDITSSARGAVALFPRTRLVVDVGAQSSRAIAVTETGRVAKFKMNEKCAAGAGRFVERCSKYLQIPLDEMGPLALSAAEPRMISSVCAVLAETEIINNVAEGVPLPDILMGVFLSLAQRARPLMTYVGIQPEVTLVGGLVRNPGMVRALGETTDLAPNVSLEGHFAAALGAALLGFTRAQKGGTHGRPGT